MANKILVTGAGSGVARSVIDSLTVWGNGSYDVFTCDYYPLCHGLLRNDVEKGFILDKNYPTINQIKKIVEKHDIEMIFTTSDREMLAYSRSGGYLNDKVCGSDPLNIIFARNKFLLQKNLELLGLPFIKSIEAIELHKSSEKMFCNKTIIKPKRGSGSNGCFLVLGTKEYIDKVLDFINHSSNLEEYVVQEYIEGEEFTVNLAISENGNYIDGIYLKRHMKEFPVTEIRQISHKDIIARESVSMPDVVDYCYSICRKLKLVGPVNLQGKIDKEGKVFIFEINPRFCGSTSFSAYCGMNGPELMYRYFFNNKVMLVNSNHLYNKICLLPNYECFYTHNDVENICKP